MFRSKAILSAELAKTWWKAAASSMLTGNQAYRKGLDLVYLSSNAVFQLAEVL